MSTVQQRMAAVALAWRRADQALAPEDEPSHLPWIVAIMAFIAGLALSVALALSGMASRWSADLTGVLTVEIAAESASDPRSPDERLEAVLAVLRATPGIERATPVPNERLAAMIEPWLGKAAAAGELPLPRIIDVQLNVPSIDLAALAPQLAAAAADTTVDDHRRWLGGLLRFARNAVTLALALVVLVSLAASGTVAFATRAGLAAHHEAIELLHLMGAQDTYIARQFARLVLLRSALGAAGGIIVAVLVFYGLALSAQTNIAVGTDAPAMLTGPLLGIPDFALLVLLPVAIIAVATVTAWWTVMRALRGMV
jgi:cell division transport system permease protein